MCFIYQWFVIIDVFLKYVFTFVTKNSFHLLKKHLFYTNQNPEL